ncbi:hypothetical protein HDU76_003052 [Blyttiomyces sp. JEL0837]|nr:hypothetical protein HDU76_003052 [Blyttiomyces sp. JEL0837]
MPSSSAFSAVLSGGGSSPERRDRDETSGTWRERVMSGNGGSAGNKNRDRGVAGGVSSPSAVSTGGGAGNGGTGEAFMSVQRRVLEGVVEECLATFRMEMREEIQNMHLELLRQFQIQKVQIEQLFKKHSPSEALMKECIYWVSWEYRSDLFQSRVSVNVRQGNSTDQIPPLLMSTSINDNKTTMLLGQKMQDLCCLEGVTDSLILFDGGVVGRRFREKDEFRNTLWDCNPSNDLLISTKSGRKFDCPIDNDFTIVSNRASFEKVARVLTKPTFNVAEARPWCLARIDNDASRMKFGKGASDIYMERSLDLFSARKRIECKGDNAIACQTQRKMCGEVDSDIPVDQVAVPLNGGTLADVTKIEASCGVERGYNRTSRDGGNESDNMATFDHESDEFSSIGKENELDSEFYIKYKMIRPLGEGGYGSVDLAEVGNTDSFVVCKYMLKKDVVHWHQRSNNSLEVYILKQLTLKKNPFVVKFMDYWDFGEAFYIVMEYLGDDWKDLFTYQPPQHSIIMVFKQCCQALHAVHQDGFRQNDVKASNFLINSKTLEVKLIDFGTGTIIDGEGTFTVFHGKTSYMSPEFILTGKFLPESQEVWSLGCMLLEMLFGSYNFEEILKVREPGAMERVETVRNCSGVQVSDNVICGIASMLERDPARRISLEEILLHPMFSE